MTRQYVVAVALLGLAACATSVSEESPEDEYARVEYESERKCHYERETGSNMRVRVCRTQAEIDEERARAKRTLNEMDDSSIATGSD